ncbi:hypothetical protein N0V82_008747 [Gnomoniopsis sp. IMI 355080]|nr:hypothetical protein N0V82_008747 [Gnomoniopsis sp. IMI 355080]
MASTPQPLSINATERRPSPQYNTTASSGLSPLNNTLAATGLPQLDESDFLDAHLSSHISSHSTSRRRRGQVSESEIVTYQQWRLDIGRHL